MTREQMSVSKRKKKTEELLQAYEAAFCNFENDRTPENFWHVMDAAQEMVRYLKRTAKELIATNRELKLQIVEQEDLDFE